MPIAVIGKAIPLAGADGLTLMAEHYGNDYLPAVVFLHGGGQSRSAWRSSARELAKVGFDAWTVDLRGHGDSDWAADGDYSLHSYVRDISAVIETIGKPVALVGASLGGLISMLLAAERPHLIWAVVLADVTPRVGGGGAEAIRAFLQSGSAGFATVEEASVSLSNLMRTSPRADASGLRHHLSQRADARFYWKWDPRFIDDRFVENGAAGEPVVDAASLICQPMLLVRGGRSTVVREEDVEHFLALAPHAEVLTVKEAGHMITGDSNIAYSQAAMAFLSRHVPA